MPNMSTVTLAGHLGRDAEMKSAGGSAVCEFSIAVTTKRRDSESVAWYRCQLWGARGEKLAPMLTKGKAVIVTGELVPREYKGKGDELRTSLDVSVDRLTFAGGGEKAEKPAARVVEKPAPTFDREVFVTQAEADDSGDLPF